MRNGYEGEGRGEYNSKEPQLLYKGQPFPLSFELQRRDIYVQDVLEACEIQTKLFNIFRNYSIFPDDKINCRWNKWKKVSAISIFIEFTRNNAMFFFVLLIYFYYINLYL